MSDVKAAIHEVEFPSLPQEDVVAYVLNALQAGRCRSAQFRRSQNAYALTTGNYAEIVITRDSGNADVWSVHFTGCNFTTWTGKVAHTLRELNQLVREAARECGDAWEDDATGLRLRRGKYAGNVAALAGLIGARTIEAVFDPYLCNEALLLLTDLVSVGSTSISAGVRLLGYPHRSTGSVPRLTKAFVQGWLKEHGVVGGGVRLAADKPHRRFLLLGGGLSLVIGCSLNNIAHDETARLEPGGDDLAFFEAVWGAASLLT